MPRVIVEATPLGGHRLRLRFDDGVEGELDVGKQLRFDGVFAPLRDLEVFAAVTVDHELGTVVWPTGADLDPDVLYAAVTGVPVDSSLASPARVSERRKGPA